MRWRNAAAAVAAMVTTSACTNHLESVKVSSADAGTRRGPAYMLQFTQYKVVLTRRIVDCGSELVSVVKAEATPETVDDGDHVYTLPFDSMISPMKISELKAEWTNGKLTSVNASAEDRTAQTVLAAAQGIGTIAKTIISGGVVGAGGTVEGCSDEVVAQLAAAKTAQSGVDKHTAELGRLSPELARLKAAFAVAGADAGLRTQLLGVVNSIDAENILLEDAQGRLKKALAFLSYEEVVRWPETSSKFSTPADEPLTVPLSIFKKWYDVPFGTGEDETTPAYQTRRDAKYKQFADKMRVWLSIERVGTYGRNPSSPEAADTGNPRDGLRYRLPANGRLVVCQTSLCTSAEPAKVVAAVPGPVLQLGLIFYAPFSSPPFTNAAFAATFDELGRPKSMGLNRKTSSAETIAGLAKELGTQAASVYALAHKTAAEKAAEELAALEAEKKLVDARAALDPTSPAKVLAVLEMEKKIADARAALVPAPTYELARLTAIAQAQRGYNQAIEALALNPNADAMAQKAALEADTALLRAEAARIEAEILLRDVRQRLGT
jgi:hypothetical protein